MTTQEKNSYYHQNMVIVQQGAFSESSKCEIKRCKHKPKHLIFLGQDTRLSTLYANSCNIHLPVICKRAANDGIKRAEKWIKQAQEKEIEQAKNILNSL